MPLDYATPQPADYEVFQLSSVSTVAGSMPLLDTVDPQPYEVLDGYMRQKTHDTISESKNDIGMEENIAYGQVPCTSTNMTLSRNEAYGVFVTTGDYEDI